MDDDVRIRTAELLAVGSELLVGETRDTNSAELAASLAELGVEVARIVAVPDRRSVVEAAFADAESRVDLVVSTGGLGPTPDDLTREAIAALCHEEPAVNPELAEWLRHLFARRHLPFPAGNIKQAWLIPSATAIPNERGTAPGWWVERPRGRLFVALPGPPSEMRAMWHAWVLPRLSARGIGAEQAVRTYRLTGIGESHLAARLGDELLRAANPTVATYARAEAVDVRISARPESGRSAEDVLRAAEQRVLDAAGSHVWGHDRDTWLDVVDRELGARGWTVATLEIGTGGTLAALIGDARGLARATVLPGGESGRGGDQEPGGEAAAGDAAGPNRSAGGDPETVGSGESERLGESALHAAREAGAEVGLAIRAVEAGGDTRVEIAVSSPAGIAEERRTAFLGGAEGRRRAALAAAAFLFTTLRSQSAGDPPAEHG